MNTEYPEVSQQEWRDLEEEAGHPLLSLRQVHEYRQRKIQTEALNRVLEGKDAAVYSRN